MGVKIMTDCLHIPGNNTGCEGEMKKRHCPLQADGKCVGRYGGIGADLSAAQIMVKTYPDRRKPSALNPANHQARRKGDMITQQSFA